MRSCRCAQQKFTCFCCAVTLTITVDNEVHVYHGGRVVHSDVTWQYSSTVTLDDACVLAVKGVHYGGYGILASTSTGVVSDASWKCSDVEQSGWHLAGFDDAAWSQAQVLAAHGAWPWLHIGGISAQATWIWAQGSAATPVYCRKTLC